MKGVWAEMLAEALLAERGFTVIQRRYTLEKEGVRLAEIDLLAEKNGVRYAVEVKTGRVSTTDIRQAYSNAQLLGARPLIVAKEFADKSAEKYAEELGVEVLRIPDYLLVTPEELETATARAMERALDDAVPPNPLALERGDIPVLEALASSSGFEEAAGRLGLSAAEFVRKIAELRGRGLLGGGSYWRLRLQARILLLSILSARALSLDRPS